jgi:Fe2+ or Zn2+ uptake regulation protein
MVGGVMPSPEQLTDQLTERLRAEGRKVTPQRQAVFRALAGDDGHLTAEAVHAAVVAELPTVSLRTVYQVLHDLEALGELRAIHVGTGSTRFDRNLAPHHHLVCTSCGKVRDVVLDLGGRLADEAVDAGDGFTVERTDIVFRGRCAECGPDPTSVSHPDNRYTDDTKERPWPI